jgi:hypothetical protein
MTTFVSSRRTSNSAPAKEAAQEAREFESRRPLPRKGNVS